MYYKVKRKHNACPKRILDNTLISKIDRKILRLDINLAEFIEMNDDTLLNKWVHIRNKVEDDTSHNGIKKIKSCIISDDVLTINDRYDTIEYDMILIDDEELQIPLIGRLYRDNKNNFGIPLSIILIDDKPCVEYYQMGIVDFTIDHKTYIELLNASNYIYPTVKLGIIEYVSIDIFMEFYNLHNKE